MPVYLRYGLLLGLGQTFATLLVYFAGQHDTTATLPTAQFVENLTGFLLLIVVVALAQRAAKNAREARGEPSTFGAGAKSALALASVGALVAALGQYIYIAFINPGYPGVLRQAILDGAKDKIAGLKPEELEQSLAQLDFALSAPMRAVAQGIGTLVFATLLGLVFAVVFRAAVRREAAALAREQAAAAKTPPAGTGA